MLFANPACGTAGFLIAAGEYLREHHPEILRDPQLKEHFHHRLFHGFDFDNTMLRIGSMNMLLHGVENPDIRYRDSLAQDHAAEEEKYTLVLANPPFAGSLDYETCAKDLQQIVKTKKTELLFLALFLRLLKPGGRAAGIVPEGVLFGSSTAHKTLRKLLVEEQKLDAVISLPGGVFKPYAGVSTAILVFTKTNSGGTNHVWFYDLDADGMSLDDKRTELLPRLPSRSRRDHRICPSLVVVPPRVARKYSARIRSEEHKLGNTAKSCRSRSPHRVAARIRPAGRRSGETKGGVPCIVGGARRALRGLTAPRFSRGVMSMSMQF
jgi:N-6 DNA methylase